MPYLQDWTQDSLFKRYIYGEPEPEDQEEYELPYQEDEQTDIND